MSEKHWKLGMILVIPLLLILWWGWEDTEPVKVSDPPQQPMKGQSPSSAPSVLLHLPMALAFRPISRIKASLPDGVSLAERKETKS